MEARIAVLEHIAKTTAASLERVEQRQEQMLDRMDRRFDSIDHKFELIDRKFELVDRKFELIDRRFEAVDRRFDSMDQRWVTLNLHHRQDFLWLIAVQVATVGGLLTAMARGFHWL
ncbi:MAG TPA: hypothetical protein DDZ81_07105 [Acetobacteraceae bacterium]|nr:hypothetical protein [Acetobacteraceae bacterium]